MGGRREEERKGGGAGEPQSGESWLGTKRGTAVLVPTRGEKYINIYKYGGMDEGMERKREK